MRWYYNVSPLFGAIISVVGLLHPQRTAMHAIYEHPVPVFLGRICYGCYIWHFPIFVLLSAWAPRGYRYMIVFLIGWPLPRDNQGDSAASIRMRELRWARDAGRA